MMYLLILFVVMCVLVLVFINIHPVFGGNPGKTQKEGYHKFNNYEKGKFVNQVQTKMNMSAANLFSMMRDSMIGGKDRNPAEQVPVSKIDWDKMNSGEDSVTWFGHSALLLSIDHKKILVDPMLGPAASPVTFVGSKRYSEDMLRVIDDMPAIDAVLITHDHYDHLDYHSILKLKNKTASFFVPHGVSAHLIRWGVAKEKITELNWWDEIEYEGLTVAFTPSKHFSGRGMFNKDTTLWGGWVILGENNRFYISGDGGYDAHFKEIGEKYGPFDLAFIEGGQYDHRWSWVHMTPEEAVQAALDVKSKKMMLIHWGAFTLAYHSWTDPIERAIKEAEKAEVNLIAQKIGKTVSVSEELSLSSWWKS